MMQQRSVFFISDGTAITAETLGHSLLTQFDGVSIRQARRPFIDHIDKAKTVMREVQKAAEQDGHPAIVFNTIVDPELRDIINSGEAEVLDLFGSFIPRLEQALGVKRSPSVGKAHGMHDIVSYEHRMEATNYALTHDDGVSIRFDNAELILVGVSRSGKTPTCLYMALHFGVRAANYPLTDDDLQDGRLPHFLRKHKKKLYGLTITPERLVQIRETRRPGSRYASMKQCRMEIETAEALLRGEGIPIISTTHSSIEEIASRILNDLGLQKQLF